MKNLVISLGCLGTHDPPASTSYILGFTGMDQPAHSTVNCIVYNQMKFSLILYGKCQYRLSVSDLQFLRPEVVCILEF